MIENLLCVKKILVESAPVILAVITYFYLREIRRQRKENAKPELHLSMATRNSARAINVGRGIAYNIRVELEHPKDSRLNVKDHVHHVLTPIECISIEFNKTLAKLIANWAGTQLYIKVMYDGLYEKDLSQRLEITDKVEFPKHPVFPEKCKETVVL